MSNGMLKRLRHTIAKLIGWLPLIVKARLFRWRWGMDLTLPSALHPYVEGGVLSWQENWLQQLEQALARLPRVVIKAARVRYVFVAHGLQMDGRPHEGVAYEFQDKSLPACMALSDPRWIGLDASLLTHHLDETDLRVPLLDARLLEEIAHVWDFRLEAVGSPYSSAGAEWRKVEFDQEGRRKPFNIPNRRMYASMEEQNAEDWAAAVVWYVFQHDQLRRRAPEHDEFVEQLFQRCLLP